MTGSKPSLELLRSVPVLADLEDSALEWFLEHGEYREYAAGETLVEQGSPADRMVFVLAGRFEFHFPGQAEPLRVEAGAVTGLLPFSRMTQFTGSARASEPVKALLVYKPEFMPMLSAIPELGPRLVGILTDRVRVWSQSELRQEKLMSLGKLSAGLAHELNNPASAAKRSAAGLLESFGDLERAAARVGEKLGAGVLEGLLDYLQTLQPRPMSAMARADLEEEIGGWLETQGNPKAWEWASTWADAGASVAWLEGLHTLKTGIPKEAMPEVLGWLEASIRVRGLVGVVQDSTERISGLVKAIKSYTYMDQMPKQEIDVREGLDNTLAIFGYKLKKGIALERDYDPNLPKLEANGAELNQVWTNLIDNALDAMNGSGTLRVRAVREGDSLLVEIGDSGPGIPPEVVGKIFDPFFTTKEVGKGTGLGLETARRIVEAHKGSIRVESKPGDTRFQVRLPLSPPA
ncbi:MAG: hypothetical protein C4331_06790 [Meiothermus sp.]